MAEKVKNSTENVSAAKGVKGGYFFSAPLGTAVPTDITSALDENYVNLGYVLEDGFVFSEDTDNTEVKDINGDTIANLSGSRTETVQVTLAEVKKDTLSEVRGHANVKDEKGILTVKHNSEERETRVYVLELILKDGRRQRSVIPAGKVTEIGDVTYHSSDVVAFELTITCFVDENGDTVIDYIESNETVAEGLAAKAETKVAVK